MSNQLAYCTVSISPVRAENSDASEIKTQLLFGEIIEIIERTEKWLHIRTYFDNYTGWIDPKQVKHLTKKEVSRWMDGLTYQSELINTLVTPWGKQNIFKGSYIPSINEDNFNIGNDEFSLIKQGKENNSISPIDIALDYLNAPYLWGGKTPFGIDCSGITQVVYRFLGINLPRDASQQVDYGNTIDFEERLPGDLFFFENENGKITHVGIIKNENEIIHASGQVKIDQYDSKGIIHSSKEYYTHKATIIKRLI